MFLCVVFEKMSSSVPMLLVMLFAHVQTFQTAVQRFSGSAVVVKVWPETLLKRDSGAGAFHQQ